MANNKSRQQQGGRNRSEGRSGSSHSQGHDEWNGPSRSGSSYGGGEGDEERFDRNVQGQGRQGSQGGQGRGYGEEEDYGRQFESSGRGTQTADRDFERSGRDEFGSSPEGWNRGGSFSGGGEPYDRGGATGSYGGRFQQSFRTQERYGGQERFSPQFGGSDYGTPGRDFSGRAPKNYRRDDMRIQEDICEQLTRHPDIDPSEVEVTVQDGEVTLSGSVDNKHAKRMIEDIAESASGVSEVQNQLRVANGSSRQSSGKSSGGYQDQDEDEESSSRSGRSSGRGSSRSGGSSSGRSRSQSTASSARQARNRGGNRSRQR